MIEIVKGLKISKLITDSSELRKELDEVFSVDIPGREYMPLYQSHVWDGKRHFFSALRGTFPTGFLCRVCQYLFDRGLTFKLKEGYQEVVAQTPLLPNLLGISLRENQIDAVTAMLEHRRGILKASTNSGKTTCAAEIIRIMNVPTLYLLDRKILLHQTAGDLERLLGIPIGKVGDGIQDIQKVTVAMPQSIVYKDKSKGLKKAKLAIKPELVQLIDRPLMVLDEADTISDARMDRVVSASMAAFRIAMSGTPLLNDVVTNMTLIGHFGEIIYEITNASLIEKGISSVPTCRIIKINCENISSLGYSSAYSLGIVNNRERNQKIKECAEAAQRQGLNTLVIAKEVDHVLGIHELVENSNFVHYKLSTKQRTERLNEFKEGNGTILISSTIMDRGVDTDKIDLLILAGGGKSEKQVLQRIGRGLRKNRRMQVEVVDFLDVGNMTLLEHSIARITTMKAEGFSIDMY